MISPGAPDAPTSTMSRCNIFAPYQEAKSLATGRQAFLRGLGPISVPTSQPTTAPAYVPKAVFPDAAILAQGRRVTATLWLGE